MKKGLAIIILLIVCLCCSDCVPRNTNTGSELPNQGAPSEQIHENQSTLENEDEQTLSETDAVGKENNQEDNATMNPSDKALQEEIGEYDQEKYESYLEHFFLIFSQKFSSVSQLNQESVLFFTLVEMIDEYPREEIPFEYDVSLDAYYVPKYMVNEKVEQYFGISDFNFVDTSRYFPKKDSYTYTLAHGFPILYPQIISVNRQGSRLIFTVDYTNPEREGNPTMQTLLFTFEEIEANGRNYLQAVSADG